MLKTRLSSLFKLKVVARGENQSKTMLYQKLNNPIKACYSNIKNPGLIQFLKVIGVQN